LQATDPASHAINLVAAAELRHARPDALDDAREIDAQNGPQRMTRVSRLPLAYLDVERIDRARLDPDQHLAGCSLGTRIRTDLKRRVGRVQDDSSHLR
jgi:hypothetical protein